MRALTFSSLGKVAQMRMTTQKEKKKRKGGQETPCDMEIISHVREGFFSAFTYIIYQFRD